MIIDRELRIKLKELANKKKLVDGVEIPGSVVFLNDLLKKSENPLDREDIYSAIAMEYSKAGLVAQEINTLRAKASEFKNEFMFIATLADRLRYEESHYEESKNLIEDALTKAKEKNEFVRLVLGIRARIARQIRDQELFSQTVSELIADYKSNKRELDIGFEDDFTKELPKEFCSDQKLKEYLALNPRIDESRP